MSETVLKLYKVTAVHTGILLTYFHNDQVKEERLAGHENLTERDN
jgi:hypothetical protein